MSETRKGRPAKLPPRKPPRSKLPPGATAKDARQVRRLALCKNSDRSIAVLLDLPQGLVKRIRKALRIPAGYALAHPPKPHPPQALPLQAHPLQAQGAMPMEKVTPAAQVVAMPGVANDNSPPPPSSHEGPLAGPWRRRPRSDFPAESDRAARHMANLKVRFEDNPRAARPDGFLRHSGAFVRSGGPGQARASSLVGAQGA